MAKRSVSTRTRFEVFKRDGFKCVYCGASPLNGALHVDHVEPVSKGGDSTPANLVTACDKCNLGKGAVRLVDKRLKSQVATDADRDHATQIMEFLKIQREVDAARKQAADVIAERWEELIGPLTERMYQRLGALIQEWSLDRLEQAMQITARKLGCPDEEFKASIAVKQSQYFHGILRNWRERGE